MVVVVLVVVGNVRVCERPGQYTVEHSDPMIENVLEKHVVLLVEEVAVVVTFLVAENVHVHEIHIPARNVRGLEVGGRSVARGDGGRAAVGRACEQGQLCAVVRVEGEEVCARRRRAHTEPHVAA